MKKRKTRRGLVCPFYFFETKIDIRESNNGENRFTKSRRIYWKCNTIG